MRRRLPWILLAVSVALNLALVAGAVYVKHRAQEIALLGPREKLELAAERMDLDPAQREAFFDLAADLRARVAAFRADVGPQREQVFAELAAEDFDRARVETAMNATTDTTVAFFVDLAARIHGFVATLEPDQKRTFFRILTTRRLIQRLGNG